MFLLMVELAHTVCYLFFNGFDTFYTRLHRANDVFSYTMFDVNVLSVFFFQAEDGIRDWSVTGVQTCALPILGKLTNKQILVGCLDLHGHVAEVETAHQDLLVRELSQHGTIELGLRGLDRDLTTRARRELRQERVSGRALVNEGRIAEAEMNRRRTGDALQRSIERLQAVFSGSVEARLHVRLIDLNDVGAGVEEVTNLLVHRSCVGQSRRFFARIGVVLGLARHR